MHVREAAAAVTSAPPSPAAVVASLAHLTPAQRRAFRRWINHMRLKRFLEALPPPSTRWGSPSPISSLRCDSGPVKDLIVSVFGVASEWAQSVAVRESHCTAGAYNSSGASGVMQVMMPMHAALVSTTCGNVSVFDASCNVRVAYQLFDQVGPSPWAL